MKKIIIAITILFLQSCVSLPHHIKNTDCSKIDSELDLRYSLFEKLDEKEIFQRKNINVPTYSALNELSVFSKIVQSVKNTPQNAKTIPVDLRNYASVGLGNIIISNYSSDYLLDLNLKTSKYNQGFFVLINFGSEFITIAAPPNDKLLKRERIYRSDLSDAEIVINVSDSKTIMGNMKFSPNQKVSIIADRINDPYRLDLRENKNAQFYLDNKWIMPVYSIEESDLNGGKDTAGFFQFVNNKNTKRIKMDNFSTSKVACYKDPEGKKFD